MADKQRGTGAPGKQDKKTEQGKNEYGNHTKISTDNRSRQVKDNNNSTSKTDRDLHRS